MNSTHFIFFAGKDCGFPGRPSNGSALSAEKFFYPGEEVAFECDEGFVLFGRSRRTCMEGGAWSDNLPECSEYRVCYYEWQCATVLQ